MLEENIQKQINVLIERYPQIDNCKKEIEEAYLVLEESYANGNKLLVAGNGGSAADSEHIVGELMKGFENPRNLSSEYFICCSSCKSKRNESCSSYWC